MTGIIKGIVVRVLSVLVRVIGVIGWEVVVRG